MPVARIALVLALVAASIMHLCHYSIKVQASDPGLLEHTEKISKLKEAKQFAPAIKAAEDYVAILATRYGEEASEYITAIRELALLNESDGRYADAEFIFRRVLAIREKVLGPRHREVARSLHDLAFLFLQRKRGVEVEELLRRALAIEEETLGPDNPEVAHTLSDLAIVVYGNGGKSAEIEKIMLRVLAIRETLFGRQHPDLLETLTILADFHLGEDRYDSAAPLLNRMIEIGEAMTGVDQLGLVGYVLKLVDVRNKQNRQAEVATLLQRAFGIIQKMPDSVELIGKMMEFVKIFEKSQRAGEVETLLQRAFAILQRMPDSLELSAKMRALAKVFEKHQRTADVEWLLHRALQISETNTDPSQYDLSRSLEALAFHYEGQQRFEEAETYLKKVLALGEQATAEREQLRLALTHLADFYKRRDRIEDAQSLLVRASAIDEEVTHLSADRLFNRGRYEEAASLYRQALAANGDGTRLLERLATIYQELGRFREAEPLLQRRVAVLQKVVGNSDPEVATTFEALGQLHTKLGQYTDAERYFKSAIAIREKELGAEHPLVASLLYDLAFLYSLQFRFNESAPLATRAVDIINSFPDARGTDSQRERLAKLYSAFGYVSEAEGLYKGSIYIKEALRGKEHPDVATALYALAEHYQLGNRDEEAEPLLQRALAIREKAFGLSHVGVGELLNGLGHVRFKQGRLLEAAALHARDLAISEATLGPDHPALHVPLGELGNVHFRLGDWKTAAAHWRRSTEIAIRRFRRVGDDSHSVTSGQFGTYHFEKLIDASYRSTKADTPERHTAAEEMFKSAQWAANSHAGVSLGLMAARQAKGIPDLTMRVRERQDLVAEWQALDKLLLAAISRPSHQRSVAAESAHRTRLIAIDDRILEIDGGLRRDFPEYSALARPEPLSIREVQALLSDDEALLLFLDVDFAWAVTKTNMRWVRIEREPQQVIDLVGAVRCGLDSTAWSRPNNWPEDTHQQKWEKEQQIARRKRCVELLRSEPAVEDVQIGSKQQKLEVLPFDLVKGHELYKALLGPFEDMIRGKRLLFVPSDRLANIPFNVLVHDAPGTTGTNSLAQYRNAAWLGTRQAIAVLPSPASIKALRGLPKTVRARRPYLGIGNPLLNGANNSRERKLAALAVTKQQCAKKRPILGVASSAARPLKSFSKLFRGRTVDIEAVREWSPLPETADELCEIAHRLGVHASDIKLGANATERTLKSLSESGQLAEYAILHFATHGALAGQVKGSSEPGLILTPPPPGTDPTALEHDDGFLDTSEIAALRLDADWVILSACNTAGGSSDTAQTLSGMARAFFYAGARTLLVSHWEVGSDAAVKLTTRAFAQLKSRPDMARAEALRISMRELIKSGSLADAHPSMWAPFVVVGEGAR